jgi:peroxiredoxin
MSPWLMLVLGGCVHPRVASLEQRVTTLEADMARIQGEPVAPNRDQEPMATELLNKANHAWDVDLDARTATSLLIQLHHDFPGALVDVRADRLRTELSVIGEVAPPLSVEWIQGSTTWAAAPVTLVVFFEEWCPHCAREMPILAERAAALQGRGVQVVGLTKLTRSSTLEELQAFLVDKGIRFPIGKEDGQLSKDFEVSGIPAAALVKGDKVIWRGHPAKLDDERLQRLLAR